MRKKVFITGGLLALFLLLSSGTAFAASLKLSSDEITTIKTEITSGKPVRDVLKEHNISMDQIRTALGTTGIGKDHLKLSNTQISNIATKLGLDPAEIQTEIDSGKTLQEILAAHKITPAAVKAAFGEESAALKHAGHKSAKKHL